MRKILAILAIVGLHNSYSQVVDSVTGNLVNTTATPTVSTSTWQGAGLFNGGLPCWSPDDEKKGAYCGPNAYVNNGDINFSYGMSNVHQYVNVAKSLPYSGAGLVTSGFKFGWTSKNGNYWEGPVNLDVLSSYVQLLDKGNKVVENFNWDLNYIHNWTTFNYDKNWSKPYRPNEVSNVKFGFIGMDTSNWAGPYGPEITNINFQLKYRPDPCVKNPLFSPDCPNFTKELAEKTAIPTTNTQTSSTVIDNPKPHEFNDTPTRLNEFTFGEKEEGVYKEDILSDKLEHALYKIFTDQVVNEEKSISIAHEAVEKAEQIAIQTTKQAEQRVMDEVKKSMQQMVDNQQQSQQQIIDIKPNTQNNLEGLLKTPEPNSGATGLFQLPTPQATKLVDLQPNINQTNTPTQQTNNTILQQNNIRNPIANQIQQNNIITETSTTIIPKTNIINKVELTNNVIQNIQQHTINNDQQIIIDVSNVQVSQPLPKQDIEVIKIDTNNVQTQPQVNVLVATVNTNSQAELPVTTSTFLTNKADPLNQLIEEKPTVDQDKKVEDKPQVLKQNVVNNELATGSDISTIAVMPVGYNVYTNLILRDVAFYTPKEIYRNQKTVDNVRALRQLASDRLHQELVDQQYRR